jgi:hypothetical protein
VKSQHRAWIESRTAIRRRNDDGGEIEEVVGANVTCLGMVVVECGE